MNTLSRIWNLAFGFSALALISAGQTRSFDRVPTQDGEVNLSVRQLIQDHTGFLWIATFSGLYKYEGDENIKKLNFIDDEQINSDVTLLL